MESGLLTSAGSRAANPRAASEQPPIPREELSKLLRRAQAERRRTFTRHLHPAIGSSSHGPASLLPHLRGYGGWPRRSRDLPLQPAVTASETARPLGASKLCTTTNQTIIDGGGGGAACVVKCRGLWPSAPCSRAWRPATAATSSRAALCSSALSLTPGREGAISLLDWRRWNVLERGACSRSAAKPRSYRVRSIDAGRTSGED